MFSALVSIVIPTYNRPALLRRAVRSALCQSYDNIEVVVIDDSRTGTALRVCDQFQDGRLRAYRNRNAKGACGCRNTGIELARGEFYAGLDDDDYFHQDRIAVLLNSYRKEYSFVASNFQALRRGVGDVEFRGERLIRLSDLLWGRNCVGGQILTDMSKVRTVGGFDESLAAGQDIDLWIRIIQRWGSALRIAPCLYTADLDHDGPRITTTVKISKRTQDFLDRHGDKMSHPQRLVNLTRLWRHSNKPYALMLVASLCFPASWNYYLKRVARIW